MKTQNPFIKKVVDGFSKCNVEISSCNRIGVAVSGGADSVSLLLSLVEIFGKEKIFVITVNHNIREESETKGDADFVLKLCEKIGVFCLLFEIEKGRVFEIAKNRQGGVEDSARFLRYEAFNSFIERYDLDFLCLAHNQNDQLETAIMRFLQGSGCDGGGGISFRREKFVRPLLDISRFEIESFLNEKNQTWRTDSTNFDTDYLRNKIRNVLIPQIDENFVGWRKSVLNGVEKNKDDEKTLSNICDLNEKFIVFENDTVSFPREKFDCLENSIKRRIIHKMFSFFKYKNISKNTFRFPYKLIREIYSWKSDTKNHLINFENLIISCDSNFFSIKVKSDDEKIIESGFYEIVNINEKNFIFRSFQNSDSIKMKNSNKKDISKIFSEWKVSKSDKEKIVIVQDCESLEIVAVIGDFLKYENWIIEEYSNYNFSRLFNR